MAYQDHSLSFPQLAFYLLYLFLSLLFINLSIEFPLLQLHRIIDSNLIIFKLPFYQIFLKQVAVKSIQEPFFYHHQFPKEI